MRHRPTRSAEVKARVSTELKHTVQALAAARGDENESVVLRDALTWYCRRPDIAPLVEEGKRKLALAKAREEKGKED